MMGKAKIKFSRYDSADYLKSKEDIAAYLKAVAEENNPALVIQALGTVARARNMAELARETGITRQGLYKALSGEGDPSFGNVMKIASALGYQLCLFPAEKSTLDVMAENLALGSNAIIGVTYEANRDKPKKRRTVEPAKDNTTLVSTRSKRRTVSAVRPG